MELPTQDVLLYIICCQRQQSQELCYLKSDRQYPSAKVHRSVSVKALVENPRQFSDYEVSLEPLEELKVTELIDGE